MMQAWLKPCVKMTDYRHIVARYEIEYEDETEEKMDILTFNGISNRWSEKNGTNRDIMMKDISMWLPIPEVAK